MKMTRKFNISSFQLFLFFSILLVVVYFSCLLIKDNKMNYIEVSYYTAMVKDKGSYSTSDTLLSSSQYYLEVIYGDYDYTGLILVSKYLYNRYEIGDSIDIKVYDKYRRSDNRNIESIILLNRVGGT
jgi:hypothetical protein